MIILSIRTDKPEAEIGLFDGKEQLVYKVWHAHRQLAESLHSKILKLLESQHKSWNDIGAIVAFTGPGSFTGLRIGLSVANALAYSYMIPIVGASGEDWIHAGSTKLLEGQDEKQILPKYGSPAHTTLQKN